ncbi:MAG: TolC family protein [Chitinophagaceae bacterium]|nr:TolC family protein [Chitinophagaceae bacterium]
MLIKTVRLFVIYLFFTINAKGQSATFQKDSLSVSIDSAEHLFLENNLMLLAQKYNIDAQKALVLQAKLYPNPNINYNHGLYHPDLKKIFATGSDGESAASLSQVIILARKRNKQIQIAETNTKLAEYQFYDLIRTLKYTLRVDFYNIYFLQQSSKVYADEIRSLQQVVNAFEQQKGKGYISEKEVMRIKAQLYGLQSEYNDLINQINDIQSELRLVLQIKNYYIKPIVDETHLNELKADQYPITALIDTAYIERTDLKIARTNVDLSNQVYSLQKALATPDITLQAGYDKQGSYIHHFNSIGFSMDIPIFNRNQGNIKSAKSGIDISSTFQKFNEATVEEQISRAMQKAIDNQKLYQKMDPSFSKDFEKLVHEVISNYQKRNLGLLEFIDFYDSYKQNTLQINAMKFNKISALEDINFYTAKNFFN